MKRVKVEPEIIHIRPGIVKRKKRATPRLEVPIEEPRKIVNTFDELYYIQYRKFVTPAAIKTIFKEAKRLGIKK